jgi:hypothetical protein
MIGWKVGSDDSFSERGVSPKIKNLAQRVPGRSGPGKVEIGVASLG